MSDKVFQNTILQNAVRKLSAFRGDLLFDEEINFESDIATSHLLLALAAIETAMQHLRIADSEEYRRDM